MKPEDTRNHKQLIQACNAGWQPKFVFFWGHTPPKDGAINKSCFSQWYNSPFTIDNIYYPTAEHYMMASKARLFNDNQTLSRILKATHPGEAKSFGREVKNFIPDLWSENCFEIVVKGNLAKFSQNTDLGNFLLNTGNRVLVEASPRDTIWGIGLSEKDDGANQPIRWKGQNLLGFALMETRSQLAYNK